MITIQEITSREVWDSFLDREGPHTFLQSWNWGSFNQALGSRIWRLGFFHDANLVGAALVIKISARRGSFFLCPHGPIMVPGNEDEILPVFLEYLKAYAREESVGFIRIAPLLENSQENLQMFKALSFRASPVHMVHPEYAWILDVTPSEDNLFSGMRKQTRHCVKFARDSGVTITTSTDPRDIEVFNALYQKTVDRRHFTPFSRQYLEQEFAAFARDNQTLLLFGWYRDEPISAAFVIFAHGSAFYHHGASVLTYPKLPASHLLQWEAIREAKKRGCAQYNFWGVAPENTPAHPWAGLTLFKKGFGGASEEYLHAHDYVLRPSYWITWSIEKLRTIQRGL